MGNYPVCRSVMYYCNNDECVNNQEKKYCFQTHCYFEQKDSIKQEKLDACVKHPTILLTSLKRS